MLLLALRKLDIRVTQAIVGAVVGVGFLVIAAIVACFLTQSRCPTLCMRGESQVRCWVSKHVASQAKTRIRSLVQALPSARALG